MSLRTRLPFLLTLFGGMMLSGGVLAAEPLPRAERVRWFQDAKFGIAFHWGLHSLLGEGEWAMSRKRIVPAEYARLAGRFRPAQFRAQEWIDLARRAGAKYVVVPAKDHDGFCLFDSKLTDFTIVKATPLKRDVLRELADECRRQGLKFGVSYSILDWHHPDFLPAPAWDRDNPRRQRADAANYFRYLEGQLRELCTNYGRIDLLCYDGGWHHTDEASRQEFARINQVVRTLQPHILINRGANTAEDFGTPAEPIPATGLRDTEGNVLPWEASLTLNAGYGSSPPAAWRGYDRNETVFRQPADVLRTLVDAVSRGGNLLVHVGPRPDGLLPQEAADTLEGVGAWLGRHGEAVYGAGPSPFTRLGFWGRATRKDSTLYLHAFQWPSDRVFLLPGMSAELIEAGRVRGSVFGDPLAKVTPLFRPLPEPLYGVRVLGEAPDPYVSIIKLPFTRWPRLGSGLKRPDAQDSVHLPVMLATVVGQRARVEAEERAVYLTEWRQRTDFLTWQFELPGPGRYEVVLEYACASDSAGGELAALVGQGEVRGVVRGTGSATTFRPRALGEVALAGGPQTLTLQALSIPKDKELLRLRGVVLRPVKG